MPLSYPRTRTQSFRKATKAQGQPGNYHCGNCHTPMADNLADLMAGKVEPTSANPTETEGPGCSFCHRIENVVEKERFNQYMLNKDGAHHTSRLGGHDIEVLKKAATLDAEVKAEDGRKTLTVQVKNIIEHSFPSTHLMRMALVKIVAKDKQAVFFKAFKASDKVGVPVLGVWGHSLDTRLKAGEMRTLSYPLDNPAVSTVDVTLLYLLFPPKAIESFGIPKDGVNEKKYPVAKKTLTM